jgi:tetratricopeptide (TPR) repeat protein
MATRKNSKKKAEETLVDIEEVTGQAKDFLNENQNKILIAIAAVAIIAGGIWAYFNLYQEPREISAAEQMFQAELVFERDSFRLALENPGGGYEGFLGIIDKFSGTKVANRAKYYAGVCYLNLGEADNAIKYLSDFSPKGELLTIMKYGTLGDAHGDKEDYEKAMSNYKKAISSGENEQLTAYYLKKVGLLNERQGNLKAAVEAYETIKNKYPNSVDGASIDKYIARASASLD